MPLVYGHLFHRSLLSEVYPECTVGTILHAIFLDCLSMQELPMGNQARYVLYHPHLNFCVLSSAIAFLYYCRQY